MIKFILVVNGIFLKPLFQDNLDMQVPDSSLIGSCHCQYCFMTVCCCVSVS